MQFAAEISQVSSVLGELNHCHQPCLHQASSGERLEGTGRYREQRQQRQELLLGTETERTRATAVTQTP